MEKTYTISEKEKHAVVGARIKIVLPRTSLTMQVQDPLYVVDSVHTVIKYPADKIFNDTSKGVYVQGTRKPLLIWYFEFIPHFGRALKRTKKPVLTEEKGKKDKKKKKKKNKLKRTK